MAIKTANPIISITNALTGETIEREMTIEEFNEWKNLDEARKARELNLENELNNQKSAILEKLGITEDEARLLLT